MINKIRKKVGGISIRRENSRIRSTKFSLTNLTNVNAKNANSVNNESVIGGLSNADTSTKKRPSSRSTSTVSPGITGITNEAIPEGHELDVHKDNQF